jgi:hypothetical protein
MSRTTRTTTAALTAALSLAALTTLSGSPASAEAVVYDSKTVRSVSPSTGDVETASVDIPTGYDRDRRNWHRVSFVENAGVGRVITVDLAPKADTLAKLKRQRGVIKDRYADSYREFSFTVIKDDAKAAELFRARWTYTFAAPGTGDPEPFITVYLKQGNRLQVVGSLQDKEQVKNIRRHIIKSLDFSR